MNGVNSPLRGWLGGKYRLANKIIERIPKHKCYVEPFAGAAWVLFRKEPSKVEVLNDFNSEIINLYRVIQNHLEEFVRQFKWMLRSRDEFDRLKRLPADTLTDIQRAARFYYLQRNAFAGKAFQQCYTYGTERQPGINLLRIEEELSLAHLRLASVNLENLSFDDLIPRYDRAHTFFFVDPPYWDRENYYGKGLFEKDDFARLVVLLGKLKGKFLLTLNDVPEVREMFGAFELETVQLRYTSGKGCATGKELFISNC